MATTAEKVRKIAIAEGRVAKIDLPIEEEEASMIDVEDPESPVVVRFVDRASGRFINIFDHRVSSREGFRQGGIEALKSVWSTVPCLCGFRMKGKTQYFVINEIGTADMRDGREKDNYILTYGGNFPHSRFVVAGRHISGVFVEAIHLSTTICLIKPRSPKPV